MPHTSRSITHLAVAILTGTSLSLGSTQIAQAAEVTAQPQQTVTTPNAAPAQTTPGQQNAEQTESTPHYSEYGLKGWVAKKSLKEVAWLLRKSPQKVVDLAGDTLDKEAKTKLVQHSHEVADVIDDVADTTDLVSHVVREKLHDVLTPIVGYSNAYMIADVIVWLALL